VTRPPWIGDLVPPVVARARAARHATQFDDSCGDWAGAVAAAPPEDWRSVLAKVERAMAEVAAGRAAIERDGVALPEPEYRWPVVAGLLREAARAGGSLAVVDVGGSLGSTYRQYRDLLAGVDVRWAVVEQQDFVDASGPYADDRLSFHTSIADAAGAVDPQVVLFSSVLQYLPEPHAALAEASATTATTLIIDRTPVTSRPDDIPAVQIVPPSIYAARYPVWLLSRPRLLDALGGWTCLDEFPGLEPDARSRGGVPIAWRGFLLVRDAA
jgi:putative methyltransferase (TIGR04325 family)